MKMKNMKMDKTYARVFIVGLFILMEFVLLDFDLIKMIGVDGASFPAAAAFAPAVAGIIGPVAAMVIILTNTVFALVNGNLFGGAFLVVLVYMGIPLACASLYFGWKNKGVVLIPAACMLAFWLHPIGSQIWYFAVLWVIPIAIRFIPHGFMSKIRNISHVLNGVGTAFVDHAVGSVLYLYAVNIPVIMWQSAFPLAIFERITFGFGIAASYFVLKYTTLGVENTLNKKFRWNIGISKLFGVDMN